MTTRAGSAGLLAGLIATLIIYPLFMAWPDAFLQAGLSSSTFLTAGLAAIILVGGGFFASRWSGSVQPGRSAALGGLAGGLAGTIIFCLWGAAAAGLAQWMPPFDHAANVALPQTEIISVIVRQTMEMFLLLFISGSCLGMLGGWLARPRQRNRADAFNKTEPQMALNASITALPASIVAAALAAAIFSRLSVFSGGQTGQTGFDRAIADLPLIVSLLLVLVSHFALTLVVPHEARKAEHLCGLDEVKMGAFVGIGAAPLLIVLLFLVDAYSFSNPLVITALVASAGMSLKSLHTLIKLILPNRASFIPPQEGWQKTEAKLFGTIANSQGSRLVVLCIGCGMLMVLPIYVSVVAVLINLAGVLDISAFSFIPEGMGRVFLSQALASTGMVAASGIALTAIYLFYLNLARWFSKWNSRHQ
jgi:hypothetical protein